MDYEKQLQRYRNRQSLGFGKNFEKLIIMACNWYESIGEAHISKIDEPFRVIKLKNGGRFEGQFSKKANPDFEGTLKGGRSICFEAKYTSSHRIKKNVITDTQYNILEAKYELGAYCGVCVGIQDKYFFVPWQIRRNMETIIGRKSASAIDLVPYEVHFKNGINFLGI